MKRKAYQRLLEWKKQNGITALLLEGARRVGKSYLAREFAKNEYKSHLFIDFSKAPKAVRQLFEDNLEQLDTLFLKLSEHYGVRLYPRQSLVVFDEIQAFPRAREAIKALVEDGRYDYLETGSLVSIHENVKGIVIPSEEERIQLFPMDFEEFLWANGDDLTMDFLRDHFASRTELGQLLHRKALDLFRQYLIVGGMPQAVLAFADSHDLRKTDQAKRNILKLYREDIQKHAGRYALKTQLVFDGIASQLSRHEKVFRLASLEKNARMREYEDAFLWLREAMVANLCYRSTEPNLGLGINAEYSTLKCYMADTGLLISQAFGGTPGQTAEIHRRLLFNALEVNQGMLVENIVAQMLVAAGHELFFFSASQGNAQERMEIDFLIPTPDISRRHNIAPIEVKSSRYYTHTSLNKLQAKYHEFLGQPYLIHPKDLRFADGILYLPIYMTPCL